MPGNAGSNREVADDYSRVVVFLNKNWRIIERRDGIQWILQRRSGRRHGQPRWVSRKYNRNKEVLLSNVHAIAGETYPVCMDRLNTLPDWFGGRP